MAFASTARLRDEVQRLFAERPFDLAFWDGSRVAATTQGGSAF